MTGRVAVLMAVIAAACLCGCGGSGGKVKVEDLGVSIRLPEGWKQGEPKASGGYFSTSEGHFFFANAEEDDPSGDCMAFDLEGKSLAEYVDGLIEETAKMEQMHAGLIKAVSKAAGASAEEVEQSAAGTGSKVASRTAGAIDGLEAIEVITEAERSTVAAYVRKGEKVYAVTFGVERSEFAKHEQAFRQAIQTIAVE